MHKIQIKCPECDYACSMDAAAIPKDAKMATCPKCKKTFELNAHMPATETSSQDEGTICDSEQQTSFSNDSKKTMKLPGMMLFYFLYVISFIWFLFIAMLSCSLGDGAGGHFSSSTDFILAITPLMLVSLLFICCKLIFTFSSNSKRSQPAGCTRP